MYSVNDNRKRERQFGRNEVEDVGKLLMTPRSTELVNSTVAEVGGRTWPAIKTKKDNLLLRVTQVIGIYVDTVKLAVRGVYVVDPARGPSSVVRYDHLGIPTTVLPTTAGAVQTTVFQMRHMDTLCRAK